MTAGETDLSQLLNRLQPDLLADRYVFCSVAAASYGDFASLEPLASFRETEGLSLVLRKAAADSAQLAYSTVMRCITLRVHSSLEAVGLTAIVASKLAQQGISCNVIAATFHDHIFVPEDQAELALSLLQELSQAVP